MVMHNLAITTTIGSALDGYSLSSIAISPHPYSIALDLCCGVVCGENEVCESTSSDPGSASCVCAPGYARENSNSDCTGGGALCITVLPVLLCIQQSLYFFYVTIMFKAMQLCIEYAYVITHVIVLTRVYLIKIYVNIDMLLYNIYIYSFC